jgi:hypothetical protein
MLNTEPSQPLSSHTGKSPDSPGRFKNVPILDLKSDSFGVRCQCSSAATALIPRSELVADRDLVGITLVPLLPRSG